MQSDRRRIIKVLNRSREMLEKAELATNSFPVEDRPALMAAIAVALSTVDQATIDILALPKIAAAPELTAMVDDLVAEIVALL